MKLFAISNEFVLDDENYDWKLFRQKIRHYRSSWSSRQTRRVLIATSLFAGRAILRWDSDASTPSWASPYHWSAHLMTIDLVSTDDNRRRTQLSASPRKMDRKERHRHTGLKCNRLQRWITFIIRKAYQCTPQQCHRLMFVDKFPSKASQSRKYQTGEEPQNIPCWCCRMKFS